jgi:hypothetical protein
MKTYTNTPHQDGLKINFLIDAEVEYWIKELGVTEQQLRNAVFIAGSTIKDVKHYLRKHELIS